MTTRFFSLVLLVVSAQVGLAQEPGRITGTVVAERGDRPLPGLNVVVVGTLYATVTDARGHFVVAPVPPGQYTVQVNALGFETESREVTVEAGNEAVVHFHLRAPEVVLEQVETVGMRRDLLPLATVQGPWIREAGVLDAGASVQAVPGVAVARRGAAGLVPSIRGLSGDRVGMYLDGARYQPSSPYGVGSPLGTLDPGFIETLEVVKGPYALTWGVGTLSAVWVELRSATPPPGEVRGVFDAGYTGNRRSFEAVGVVSGATDAVTYVVSGAHRSGDDFAAGDGTLVPADFRDAELHGRVGVQLAPASRLILQGGFRDERDLDAPGRLLDARLSQAEHLMARFQSALAEGPFRAFDLMVYWDQLSQELTNRSKPGVSDSASVILDTGHRFAGGRLTTQFALVRGVALETGFDVQRSCYDATRSLTRGAFALPDACLNDVGVFANTTWTMGRVEASGTLRTDHAWARAGVIIDSLRLGMSRDADDTVLSAAVTLSARLASAWRISLAGGTVARPANVVERYANGLPYPGTHRIAAVQGVSRLNPERSQQADLWLDADYDRLDLHLAAFARRINNYITLSPTRLDVLIPPETPAPIIRYVNGEATYWGTEAAFVYNLLGAFATMRGDVSYVWGRDEELTEPALGVAPLSGRFGGRIQAPAELFFLEGWLRWAATQTRVAASRGETTTGGYVTADVRFGLALPGTAALILGVNNVTGRNYANHLNAQDPFTEIRLPEPGHTFYARLRLWM